MKQQGNSSPSKANSSTKDSNNSKEGEISVTEFKKILVRMINVLKEETHKQVIEHRGYE
jgi:hypothetical protein